MHKPNQFISSQHGLISSFVYTEAMCVDAFMVCWEKGEEKEKATEYAIESFAFFKKQIQGKKSLSRNDTYKLFG